MCGFEHLYISSEWYLPAHKRIAVCIILFYDYTQVYPGCTHKAYITFPMGRRSNIWHQHNRAIQHNTVEIVYFHMKKDLLFVQVVDIWFLEWVFFLDICSEGQLAVRGVFHISADICLYVFVIFCSCVLIFIDINLDIYIYICREREICKYMCTHTYIYIYNIDIRGPDAFQTFPDDLLGVYPSSRYTREVYIVQFIPFPESRSLQDWLSELRSLGMDG